MRKIPRKLNITGDKKYGKTLEWLAEKQLKQVELEMQFRSLPQLRRTRNFGGVVIEIIATHGLTTVNMFVPPRGGRGAKWRVEGCFCTQCFTYGFVKTVYESGDCRTYDVNVCQKLSVTKDREGAYVLLEGVRSLDYARYAVGQPVFVTVLPCSSAGFCGCETGISMCTITGVLPEDLPCEALYGITAVHFEDEFQRFIPVPKWTTIERKHVSDVTKEYVSPSRIT